MVDYIGNNLDEDAYMEQEEEWEREGLLDPAWEKQQKKVRYSIINYLSLMQQYPFHVYIHDNASVKGIPMI